MSCWGAFCCPAAPSCAATAPPVKPVWPSAGSSGRWSTPPHQSTHTNPHPHPHPPTPFTPLQAVEVSFRKAERALEHERRSAESAEKAAAAAEKKLEK